MHTCTDCLGVRVDFPGMGVKAFRELSRPAALLSPPLRYCCIGPEANILLMCALSVWERASGERLSPCISVGWVAGVS